MNKVFKFMSCSHCLREFSSSLKGDRRKNR